MKQLSSAWDLLRASALLYRSKFRQIVSVYAMALVGAFPLIIVRVIYLFVNYDNQIGHFKMLNFVLALCYFFALLVAGLFILMAQLAVWQVVTDRARGSAWQIFWQTKKYVLPYLLIWLIFSALIFLAGLPTILGWSLVSGSLIQVGQLMATHKLYSWWITIWLAVFALPFVWVLGNYIWSFFAFLNDAYQDYSAMQRSRELVKGREFSVLSRLLSFGLLWLLFYFLVGLHGYWPSDNWLYVIWNILMSLLFIFSSFVFVPSLIIFGQVLYRELVDTRPKTKLVPRAHPILTKLIYFFGGFFLLLGLINLIYGLSSPSLVNKKMAARDYQRLADIQIIQAKLSQYYRDQGKFPDWLIPGQPLASGSQVYLWQIPTNPKVADGVCDGAYEYHYQVILGGKDYELSYCLGGDLSPKNRDVYLSSGEHTVSHRDIIKP